MSFHQLELHDQLLSTVEELGYESATPVQMQAIPQILAGHDVKGCAQTGTGKTAAFVLPALHMLLVRPTKTEQKGPRVLIVVPTRELAMQVAKSCNTYSKNLKEVRSVCICGGMAYTVQKRLLARPYDILIATPGRLIDLINQGRIDLRAVETLVLDEADRMLDMGFIGPVKEIAEKTPKKRQTLLFSATLSKSVQRLADELLKKPVTVTVSHQNERHLNIEQRLIYADHLEHKKKLLAHLLDNEVIERGIIFTSTKRYVGELGAALEKEGYSITTLHGDMQQRTRSRAIRHLREGKATILVATDVAGRGIDIPDISHVINFDLPTVPEDYVHRIGRTGRAGATGQAFTLVTRRDERLLERVQNFTGQKIEAISIPGLEGRGRDESSQRPSKGRAGGKTVKKAKFSGKPRRPAAASKSGGFKAKKVGGFKAKKVGGFKVKKAGASAVGKRSRNATRGSARASAPAKYGSSSRGASRGATRGKPAGSSRRTSRGASRAGSRRSSARR